MFQKLLNKFANKQTQPVDLLPKTKELIRQHPKEPKNYADLAQEYSNMGRFIESVALFKSAQFLANDGQEYEIMIVKTLEKLGAIYHIKKRLELGFLDENQSKQVKNEIKGKENIWCFEATGYGRYQRLRMVSEKIREHDGNLSVLDVGGGDGILATVLEKNPYFIVDPSLNGLDGTVLPFDDSSFDFTASCDVMEHIPKKLRYRYLDEVCRVTRKKAFITAPLDHSNRKLEEFFYEVTQNPYTKEHLEHEYSTQEEIENHLNDKGFNATFYPVSFEPLHLAVSILNNKYLCHEPELFKKFNTFFNKEYADICSLEPSYTYLLEINKRGIK
jgi:ubiquinone/menaquinone biosynthesis C-methylase UbiE